MFGTPLIADKLIQKIKCNMFSHVRMYVQKIGTKGDHYFTDTHTATKTHRHSAYVLGVEYLHRLLQRDMSFVMAIANDTSILDWVRTYILCMHICP